MDPSRGSVIGHLFGFGIPSALFLRQYWAGMRLQVTVSPSCRAASGVAARQRRGIHTPSATWRYRPIATHTSRGTYTGPVVEHAAADGSPPLGCCDSNVVFAFVRFRIALATRTSWRRRGSGWIGPARRPTQGNTTHDTFAQTYTEAIYTGSSGAGLPSVAVRDSNTELMYYGARFYDPLLGRFISPDSIVPPACRAKRGIPAILKPSTAIAT